MDDPFRIYAEGEKYQRDSLAAIWPELAALLSRGGEPRAPGRCAVMHREDLKPCHFPAVARITLNGHPGCAEAVRTMSSRPGGYPLRRVDPKEWRE